jgi:hypothetical protein
MRYSGSVRVAILPHLAVSRISHYYHGLLRGIEYFVATCGTFALQGGPMFWLLRTGYITNFLTGMAIRTRRGMESGGESYYLDAGRGSHS